MKYLSFRFDVDTHKCLRDGVPNLLKLAKQHGVKFTFFINVGQAVNRLDFFKGKLRGTQKKGITSLSPITKLGIKDYLIISLFNPYIGSSYPEKVKMIAKYGHEIGLHGGTNHQTWLENAKKWQPERIEKELLFGIKFLKNLNNKDVIGFASPGWNGSAKINRILKKLGFLYVADTHTDKIYEKITVTKNLKEIPTNITGEPGGVGYLEHCRAKKMDDEQILGDFKKKLVERKKLAVLYDHPYFAGTKEIALLGRMIKLAKEMSFNIIMLKDIINKP